MISVPLLLRAGRALALAATTVAAGAQQAPTLSPCPTPAQVKQADLLGHWRAQFEDLPPGALLLEQHPELADSVRGAITRDGERALVAGDVDDGEFTLEESVDGIRISATWSGTVIDGSCGREIRGDWQGASDRAALPFVLRKLP